MALNHDQLQQSILKAMQDAAKQSKPEDAQTTLAAGLADAVHRYVSTAAVTGIKVDISKGNPAAQVADGKLS